MGGVRLVNGDDLARRLADPPPNTREIISYRSGPFIGIRMSDGAVTAAMLPGGTRPAIDPAAEPLRSHLLAEGWATTSEGEIARTWPASTDPQSILDDLVGIYVTAYGVKPRHLWARRHRDEPWTAALPYFAIWAIIFVVVPAVVGGFIGFGLADRIGAESKPLFAIAAGVIAAVAVNVIVLGGIWLADKFGRD
jgi:hypothetical protein